MPGNAAQTRMVSVAGIRLDSGKSVRPFKEIICADISEFESHMPSHAVWSLWALSALRNYAQQRRQRMPGRRALQRRIAEAGYTLLLGSSNYDLKEELRQVKALAAQ